MVLLEANSVSAAIGVAPLKKTTIKRGQIVAQSNYSRKCQENVKLRLCF
ncbi:hypothetical protein H1P_270011 [Hyella patelloides LEGE 07179]|uniref:Uncharacterized protein n=1 Tax=Hyella patelloides LEGE 07179 TaxID=945734 RepID=A0A563VT01_9CYAN|nr:hypothetical protein [Hyella patelloides]VEP14518.1 hypothetical protein H1P_270011 [Hyella patelloides LEGE 07179]